jgi:hypothetical protein
MTSTTDTAAMTALAIPLIPLPAPKCKNCFEELVGKFSIAYGQCTPCNHGEATDFLLGFLRREWRRASPSKRGSIEKLTFHPTLGLTGTCTCSGCTGVTNREGNEPTK